MDSDESEEARTIFCGNLGSKVTEEILYELFLQAGPLAKVSIPSDREGRLACYGFVTFKHRCSVDYALRLFEGVHLYNCRLNLRPRKQEIKCAPNSPQCAAQIPLLPTPMIPQPMLSPNNQTLPLNNNNRTPSGRNEQYRNEGLQGRFQNHTFKRDRDNMRPNDNHRHNYKRHKR